MRGKKISTTNSIGQGNLNTCNAKFLIESYVKVKQFSTILYSCVVVCGRVEAMIRIQDAMRQNRPGEAVALFRAARSVAFMQHSYSNGDCLFFFHGHFRLKCFLVNQKMGFGFRITK